MNEALVYLPFGTEVNVHALTNAAYTQTVTLTPENRSPIVFQGSGEHDTQIGQTVIATPATGRYPQGYQVSISVSVQGRPCGLVVGRRYAINTYNVLGAVSEDSVDHDFNDSVVLFTWSAPAVPPA